MHACFCQGVVELLQHPQQLEDMKKEPKLVESMVEELLRYHTSSALATRRVADQDVELLGQVPSLSPVISSLLLWLPASNSTCPPEPHCKLSSGLGPVIRAVTQVECVWSLHLACCLTVSFCHCCDGMLQFMCGNKILVPDVYVVD